MSLYSALYISPFSLKRSDMASTQPVCHTVSHRVGVPKFLGLESFSVSPYIIVYSSGSISVADSVGLTLIGLTQLSPTAIKFCEILQNNGHYACSRSFRITSYFGTSWKLVCAFLLVNNTNLPPVMHHCQVLQIIGQIFTFNRGVPLINTLIWDYPVNLHLQKIASGNLKHDCIVWCKMYFDTLNSLGMSDGQTDRQTDRTAFRYVRRVLITLMYSPYWRSWQWHVLLTVQQTAGSCEQLLVR